MENNPIYSANRELYDILLEKSQNAPIFYQVDRFILCKAPITCQADGTLYLKELLKQFFYDYNSQKRSKPEMRQSLGNYISSFFKLYKDEWVMAIEDEDLRWESYEIWGICTQLVLYDVFAHVTKSKDPYGEFHSNHDLFKSAAFDIDDQVCLALYEEFKNRYPDYSLPLLYTLQEGNEIATDKSNGQFFHTTMEKAYTEEMFNKEAFVVELIKYYNKIQEGDNTKKVQVQALEYIEQQFSDFTKKIRQSGCYDSMALRLAAKYWRYSTNSLIKRQSTIQQMDILIMHNLLSDVNIINGSASKEAIVATTAINELKNECMSYVNSILDSYSEGLKIAGTNSPWADRLTETGIDYNGLYSEMKDKYFSQSIPLAAFKDAFISADFTRLYTEAIGKQRSTCILFMIKQLSDYVGKEWSEHAAKSIFPNEASGKEAYRKLQKNANSKSSDKYDFENILIAHIQVFNKSRKN